MRRYPQVGLSLGHLQNERFNLIRNAGSPQLVALLAAVKLLGDKPFVPTHQGIRSGLMANCRHDFLHKHSTLISKSHAVVVVEDLQVSNMSRSATGTLEEPGRHVAAKSGLTCTVGLRVSQGRVGR